MNNHWNEYIDYLRNWAETHSDETFAGMSPACFDEWRDNECEDWICPECGNSSDSVMTISEWCEELGYSEHLNYLYNLADKQNMATDICQDCFNSLLSKAGII